MTHLARPGGGQLGLEPFVGLLGEHRDDVQHRGLDPGADVDRPGRAGVGGGQVGGHDVADVDVVAGLEAVSEHGRVLALEQQPAEDRHHAGLAERVLPRPVDVAVAQRHRREPVHALVEVAVALGAELGQAVRGLGRHGVVLGRRQDLALAVDGAAGRGVHHAPHPRAAGGLEHVDGAAHVDLHVGHRVRHRLAHVDLRGHVEDHLGGGLRANTAPTSSRSRTSTTHSSAPAARAPSRFWRLPVERSSITVTSSPRSTRASTRLEPMKPDPPVTSARMRAAYSVHERSHDAGVSAPAWTTDPYDTAAAAAIAGRPRARPRGRGDPGAPWPRGSGSGPGVPGRRHRDRPAGAARRAEDACALVLRHVEAGSRILVFGDYDVDGVCSTAMMVRTLRDLGADPVWQLPSRAEGYGLGIEAVERIAGYGTALLITVDCGVTSVAEVARARELGMDVLVTDHHRPGAELPDCAGGAPGHGPRRHRWRGRRAVRRGRGAQAVGRAVRRRGPGSGPRGPGHGPRRTGDRVRHGAAARREPPHRAPGHGCGGGHAQGGPAGADAGRRPGAGRRGRPVGGVPAGAADQRRGPPPACRCGAGAHAHRGRRPRGRGRPRAGPAQPRPARDRAADPARRRGPVRAPAARRRRSWWRGRSGIPAWSASWRRGWWSDSGAPRWSSPWMATAAAGRAAASPRTTCTPGWAPRPRT